MWLWETAWGEDRELSPRHTVIQVVQCNTESWGHSQRGDFCPGFFLVSPVHHAAGFLPPCTCPGPWKTLNTSPFIHTTGSPPFSRYLIIGTPTHQGTLMHIYNVLLCYSQYPHSIPSSSHYILPSLPGAPKLTQQFPVTSHPYQACLFDNATFIFTVGPS